MSNYVPPKEVGSDVGEVDLICVRDGHLFFFEIKSGYLRKTLKDAWLHKTNTLRKAGLQLSQKKTAVLQAIETHSTLTQQLDIPTLPPDDQIHGWILDTSIEYDHEYFSGFLKVSIPEVLIALRNERHLVRNMDRFFSPDENFAQDQSPDAERHDEELIQRTPSECACYR